MLRGGKRYQELLPVDQIINEIQNNDEVTLRVFSEGHTQPLLTNDHVKLLWKALSRSQSLIVLNIYSDNPALCQIPLLSKALKLNNILQRLDLENILIGNIGICKLLKGLETNFTLRVLNLAGNNIGSQGADALRHLLVMNPTLEELDLTDNHIGDVGSQLIAVSLHVNHTLKVLNLERNQITMLGAVQLHDAMRRTYGLETIKVGKNLFCCSYNKEMYETLFNGKSIIALRSASVVKRLGVKSAAKMLPQELCRMAWAMISGRE